MGSDINVWKPNCVNRLICILVALSGALLWILWWHVYPFFCMLCAWRARNPGSCEKNMMKIKGFWKLMAQQLPLQRFILANNSFCMHQVLWPGLCYCCILKFELTSYKKVGTQSCSSSGSVCEELVTLAIVSVFHNSGNFMAIFPLFCPK